MPYGLLPPADDAASDALLRTQTASTRVKEKISEGVARGWDEQRLTEELNRCISDACKTVQNGALREQMRRALVSAARKWHYELKMTFRILGENLAQRAQALGPGGSDLVRGGTPFVRMQEFRKLLDDGTNPGIPVIKDYWQGVRLAMKAMSADPPKVLTGSGRAVPLRLRAEIAVRYAAAVENLQSLIDGGVKFCWISSHSSCSPRCAPYQGKLYSLFRGTVSVGGREYGERGTIDGIPYRPISEALAGQEGDGNGCISGYNCRHRAIAYERGSRPPQDYTEAQMKKEYAVDCRQRNYENRIRQLKTEERLLRAAGMTKDASELRKKWRRLTRDYEIYSIEHDRAFYRYRCAVDSAELQSNAEAPLTEPSESGTIETVAFQPAETVEEAEQYAKKFAESVSFTGVKNIDSVNAVNETLTRLTEKYPTKRLSIIKTERMKGVNAVSNYLSLRINTSYANSPEKGQPWADTLEGCKVAIHYYEQVLANPKNFTKSQINSARDKIAEYSGMLKCSRFSVSSSLPAERRISGTVTHEYGHILSDQLFGLINHQRANPEFEMNVNNLLYQRQQLLSETFRRARATGDVHKISHYANHDAHEFFAECFAAREFGEELPDYIQKMLEECLKQ